MAESLTRNIYFSVLEIISQVNLRKGKSSLTLTCPSSYILSQHHRYIYIFSSMTTLIVFRFIFIINNRAKMALDHSSYPPLHCSLYRPKLKYFVIIFWKCFVNVCYLFCKCVRMRLCRINDHITGSFLIGQFFCNFCK
jgi:hypothetical protein